MMQAMYKLYIGFRELDEFGSILEAKRFAAECAQSGMFSLVGENYHDGWYKSSSWVVMPSGAEYSTNYNLFVQNQLIVTHSRTGTKFISRLDGTVFLSTRKRTLNDTVTYKLSQKIHDDLCKLRYGGKIVA
jgi:hypothetical protein